MFHSQREQAETKNKDRLTGKLIGLARMMEDKQYRSEAAEGLILKGLLATQEHVGLSEDALQTFLDQIEAEMEKASPDCVTCKSCWPGNYDYDMDFVREATEEIRSLKMQLLFEAQTIAAQVCQTMDVRPEDEHIVPLLETILKAVGNNIITREALLLVETEVDRVGFFGEILYTEPRRQES